jgi:transposase InsO family protein
VPSGRAVRDEYLKAEIERVWKGVGRKVYGARKVWQQLNREGIVVARCTVERLMGELGIAGVCAKRKRPRTTLPGGSDDRPADLLERDFDAAVAPNRAWVAEPYRANEIDLVWRLGRVSATLRVGACTGVVLLMVWLSRSIAQRREARRVRGCKSRLVPVPRAAGTDAKTNLYDVASVPLLR